MNEKQPRRHNAQQTNEYPLSDKRKAEVMTRLDRDGRKAQVGAVMAGLLLAGGTIAGIADISGGDAPKDKGPSVSDQYDQFEQQQAERDSEDAQQDILENGTPVFDEDGNLIGFNDASSSESSK